MLVLAPMAIRTSALSTVHSADRRDPVELGVAGVLVVDRRLAVEGDVEDRVRARLQHLLVDRQQQRLAALSPSIETISPSFTSVE